MSRTLDTILFVSVNVQLMGKPCVDLFVRRVFVLGISSNFPLYTSSLKSSTPLFAFSKSIIVSFNALDTFRSKRVVTCTTSYTNFIFAPYLQLRFHTSSNLTFDTFSFPFINRRILQFWILASSNFRLWICFSVKNGFHFLLSLRS